jgi:cytochrome c556
MRVSFGVLVAAAAMAATVGIGSAGAQDTAAVVKKRQDAMGSFFPNYLRGFVQIARGESTDLSGVPAKAQEAAVAFRAIPADYPTGSGREAAPGTRAKPEVWSQRAEFVAAANKLADETAKLGELARAGNLDAVKAQVGAVGQACGGCHDGPPKSGGQFRFEAQ